MLMYLNHKNLCQYILLCFALLICWPISTLHAQNIVIDNETTIESLKIEPYLSYIQVDRKTFTVDQLSQPLNWQEAKAQSVSNFEKEDSWLKFTISNNTAKTKRLLLVQTNPQIPNIDLLQLKDGKLTSLYSVGARKKFNDRPIDHRHFALPITLSPNETSVFFIHSEHAPHDLIYRTFLWDKKAFFQKTHSIDDWEPFYFGIIGVMILYNLSIFIMTRERSFLFYSLFVGGAFVTFLSISGHGFQYLWPNLPVLNQRIGFIGLGFMMSFAGWFSIGFLQLNKFYPRLAKVIHYLGFVVLLELIVIIILPFDPEFRLIRLLVGTALPIYFLCWVGGILCLKHASDIAAKAYVVIWTVLIMASILTFIHEMFAPLFPIQTFTFVQICHSLEVTLLSVALANRINHLVLTEKISSAKIEAQSKFLARMSHEIRTPLNGIVGMSDLLSSRTLNSTEKHYIDVIQSSALALRQIINDILDFSKIEAGKLQTRNEAFRLKDTLQDVVHLFEHPCAEKNITLHYSLDAAISNYVKGDNDRIRQILTNLVSNAVKYTDNGSINISITKQADLIIFSVTDTGIGISSNDQERLFQPFEQASNNNLGRESSTGLGLTISRELVYLMSGDLGMSSELGKGSTFWFSLSLPETEAAELSTNTVNQDTPLPTFNILVAEDNAVNKVVISSMLQTLGMNAIVVSNGLEAFNYFKASHNDIDMVFMDCEMPTMNGFKASEMIRSFEQQERLKHTPIIALTAHTWHQELSQCFESGMNELLLKPITRQSVETLLYKYVSEIKQVRSRPISQASI